MDELEKALKTALQREAAPTNFVEQVLMKVNSSTAVTPRWRTPSWRMPMVRWMALATVALIAATGTLQRHREQLLRGEQARQQVLLALRITGSKLRVAQLQVAGQPTAKSDEGGNR